MVLTKNCLSTRKGESSVTKRKILLTVLNEDGEEEVLEVDCYSADQALFFNGDNGTVVGVEESVMKAFF